MNRPPSEESGSEAWDVVVIGAGAAGLMAAAEAAFAGRRTLLVEKNRKPGVKILMSGGTRCNITQNTDNQGIVAAYGPPGRFLHSALAAFGVAETLAMFHQEGVPTKVEPTGKIFPVSDKALDVLQALLSRAERSGATLALEEPVTEIERAGDGFLLVTPRRTVQAAKLVITTGGQSFPGSGTTGDGYRFAAQFGHTIVPPRPALVPITTSAQWPRGLAGITIEDVHVRVLPIAPEQPTTPEQPAEVKPRRPKQLAERRGSLLFAHFGLSGPVILDVSRAVSGHERPQSLVLECNFLPQLAGEQLADELRTQAAAAGKRELAGVLAERLPRRLCEALLEHAGLSPHLKLAELGRQGAQQVASAVQQQLIPIEGTLGFKKAEVTAGGVSLKEVNSSTMESKLVPGLFLAGELLDLDGPIGGYNFQAAWSTGVLAGRNV